MSDNEVNKIIAEFMNLEIEVAKNGCVLTPTLPTFDRFWSPVKYCYSLDALIPVWEKLDGKETALKRFYRKRFDICGLGYNYILSEEKDTLPQSAAHATARAILKLKEQGE